MFRAACFSTCMQTTTLGSSSIVCGQMAMTMQIIFLHVLLLVPSASDPTVWQPMMPDMLPDLLYANRAGLLDIESIFRLLDFSRFWVFRSPGFQLWGAWLRSWRIRVLSQYYYALCFRKRYTYVSLGMLLLAGIFQDCFFDATKGYPGEGPPKGLTAGELQAQYREILPQSPV